MPPSATPASPVLHRRGLLRLPRPLVVLITLAQLTLAAVNACAQSTQPAPAAAPVGIPGNLHGFFRAGQVFLTWDKVPNATEYFIYCRNTAFTSAADLTAGVVRFHLDSEWEQNDPGYSSLLDGLSQSTSDSGFATFQPRFYSTRNFTIPISAEAPGAATPVPSSQALLVLTTHASGSYHYAVTAVVNGAEVKALATNTTGPIAESVSNPQPLLVWQSDTRQARLYLQYIDVETTNLTFGRTYGIPYWVGVCPSYNTTTDQVPVMLRLWGGQQEIQQVGNAVPPEALDFQTGIMVVPQGGALWYGWAENWAYNYLALTPTHTVLRNFVQARTMDFLKFLMQEEPYYRERIDPDRIFIYGTSNGGGGALQFAYNYPDFFAYVMADCPPTNYIENGYMENTWGSPLDATMTVGFTGWQSDYLQANFSGMAAHTFMNRAELFLQQPGVSLPWIAVGHGGQDHDIPYPIHARNLYERLNRSRRAFSGGVLGGAGHDAPIWATNPELPYICRNHAHVAITNAGRNAALPLPNAANATTDYPFNNRVIWSNPRYTVGGYQDQIDTPSQFEIVLASLDADDVIDVTPRRLQRFVVVPGATYTAKNTRVDKSAIFQEQTIVADADGLLTFTGFQLRRGSGTTGGSRLIITGNDATTYATWRSANFTGADLTNDTISGPNADPDGVGLSNLARYAFALPARGPVANPATVGTATAGSASYLTLTFPCRATATDLTYILESSTDLVTWTTVPDRTYTAGANPITAQDADALGTTNTPRRFLRLRMSAP